MYSWGTSFELPWVPVTPDCPSELFWPPKVADPTLADVPMKLLVPLEALKLWDLTLDEAVPAAFGGGPLLGSAGDELLILPFFTAKKHASLVRVKFLYLPYVDVLRPLTPGDGGLPPAVPGLVTPLVFILSISLLRSKKSEFFFCCIGFELLGLFFVVPADKGVF